MAENIPNVMKSNYLDSRSSTKLNYYKYKELSPRLKTEKILKPVA